MIDNQVKSNIINYCKPLANASYEVVEAAESTCVWCKFIQESRPSNRRLYQQLITTANHAANAVRAMQ